MRTIVVGRTMLGQWFCVRRESARRFPLVSTTTKPDDVNGRRERRRYRRERSFGKAD